MTVADPPDPRCREVVQRNEEQLARIGQNERCRGVATAALRESFGACARGADGAWAPEIIEARDREGSAACDLDVRWRVVFLHHGGAIEEEGGGTGRVERSFRVVASGDEAQEYTRLSFTATDLDGDRLPELVAVESAEDHATRRSRTATEVYTAAQGRVAVYEPTRAMALLGADDVDDDGRTDFMVPAPYTWTEGSECGLNIFHEPLTLLAHALPNGGFSTTDDVAARYLRQVCPGPDADPVPPRGGAALDHAAIGLVCRRLWGATPEEALAPLRCERFRAEPSPHCEQTSRRLQPLERGECPAHYDVWAHAPPPLRLR